MKHKQAVKYHFQETSYILFIVLIILVPLGFWRDFDNGFDLVKSSILKITGGLFIITSSIYLIKLYSKKPGATLLRPDKVLDPLMILFLVSIILSAVFSVNVYLSIFGNYETQIGLMSYLYLFLIYFLLPYVINEEKKFRNVFIIIESVALIIAVFSLVEYFGLNPFNLKPDDFKRPVTPVGHPVFSAGFMVIILPFSAANISHKKSILLKIFIPLVIFFGIISTQTRSAYAALILQIILLAVFFPFISKSIRFGKKQILYSIIVITLALFSVLMFAIAFPENAVVKRFLSMSAITRLPRWFLWKDSLNMFLHYPITGTGISAFSNVFENFASYELRYSEIKGFFVNAHSNFLHTFCTTGLIGGIAYILVLLQVIRISYKNMVSAKNKTEAKYFFYAVISSSAGYIVFGIADFDDITILLYLFVLLSLFKIKYLRTYEIKSNFKKFRVNPIATLIILLIIILFSLYNIYLTFTEVSSQRIYSLSSEKFNNGDINAYIDGLNSVTEHNPEESYYRFKFAYNIFIYSSSLKEKQHDVRNMLLKRAKEEVTMAEKNYRSRLECLALKSLIELELGNEAEGLRLKDEIFKTDTTQFPYRTNLAVYYLNHNRDEAAIYEINSILNWDINNTRVMTLKVYYFERKGLYNDALTICNRILEIEPDNMFAINTIEKLKQKIR